MASPDSAIRPLTREDVKNVSALIQNALIISNSGDYDLAVIENLSRMYSLKGVQTMSENREMYVFDTDGRIDGVIGIEKDTLYSFFVAPDRQGEGVGTELLKHVERMARVRRCNRLKVGASLTAAGFYKSHGYRIDGLKSDKSYGDIYEMSKPLQK